MHAALDLPIHPTMRHPLTGEPLQAVYVTSKGRAMWPIMGGAPEPDEPTVDKPGDKPAEDQPKPKDEPGDKPLGEGGEKALKAERDARKALETELSDLKKNLAAAFGVKPEDEGKKSSETLADVQQQIADMRHENTVLALANEHRITDKDDLDLLRATRDADALQKLATRLATPAEDNDSQGKRKPGIPKPDTTQGSGHGADTKPSVSRGREMFAARRGKKTSD